MWSNWLSKNHHHSAADRRASEGHVRHGPYPRNYDRPRYSLVHCSNARGGYIG